jgi:hypothetical protein
MRQRLSYANVIATLALFFALTGGAMAANKYLTASDQITQGDLAGSTYGNPVIAAGAITSAKFNSAAVAPNSSQLSGHGLADFPLVVARVTVPVGSANVPPGGCGGGGVTAAGVNPATDVGIVSAKPGQGTVNVQVQLTQNSVNVGVCNLGDTTISAIGDYPVIVLR